MEDLWLQRSHVPNVDFDVIILIMASKHRTVLNGDETLRYMVEEDLAALK